MNGTAKNAGTDSERERGHIAQWKVVRMKVARSKDENPNQWRSEQYLFSVTVQRRNVVYWNPNGRSSMISCAIKSFKRHSQGMSLFMVCVFVF